MKFSPSENLSESQVKSGLRLIVQDGLAAEAMATLTGGAFLVSFALKFGASNFQIGLLASMPMLTNLFQLLAIYLIYLYTNRRVISVSTSLLARMPLFLIGFLPFLFTKETTLNLIILFFSFHYFFGAISGCSWTSWMKDLVPEESLGTYFANRSRLIQILNVILSLGCAFALDFIKARYPGWELNTYSAMFLLGGLAGIYGVIVLSKVPEPKMHAVKSNFFRMFKNPFKNTNYKNLMVFNAVWAFAINLAAPFFSVYLLKMLHLPLSYVVGFNILSQITNILFIRVWGRYSDKYSNKTILRICAPIYLVVILAWTFTTMPKEHSFTLPLLVLIFIFNGISVAGINLAMGNIGIKLAPKQGDAIVYLTARGMINALFAGIAPVIGGFFADFFATSGFSWNFEWTSPTRSYVFHTLDLQQWDFFFVFAFLLGLFALYRLSYVKEKGEVKKTIVFNDIANELKTNSAIAGLRSMVYVPFSFFNVINRKRKIARYKKSKKQKDAPVYSLTQGNKTGDELAKGFR